MWPGKEITKGCQGGQDGNRNVEGPGIVDVGYLRPDCRFDTSHDLEVYGRKSDLF